MTSTYSHGTCAICKERNDFLMSLHGEHGGPMCCIICRGKWHAEHGRRRKLGRIVIRAMIAFLNGGGKFTDINDLQMAAVGHEFGFDPLGYLHGMSAARDEVIELTSGLLTETLKLTHPDKHPPERQELAHRVTQGLLALQPFVFPAPTPKPLKPESAHPPPPSRNASISEHVGADAETLRFPCPECAFGVPYFYCDPCKAEWNKRNQAERDREAEMRRKRRAKKRAAQKAICCSCERLFFGKRRDSRFCSARCRQAAHRKSVTDKQRSHGATTPIRNAEAPR